MEISGSIQCACIRVRRYSERPSRAGNHEVLPTMWLLFSSFWRGHTSHADARSEYRRRSLLGEGGFVKLSGGEAERAAEAHVAGQVKELRPLAA